MTCMGSLVSSGGIVTSLRTSLSGERDISVIRKVYTAGSTQPRFLWIPNDLSSGGKSGRGVRLVSQLHIVPRLRMNGTVTPLALYAFIPCTGTASSELFQDFYWFLQRLMTFPLRRYCLTRYACNVTCSNWWVCGCFLFVCLFVCLFIQLHTATLRLIVRSWLDVSTFTTKRLHVCNHARAPSGGRWNCGQEMSGNFAEMTTSTPFRDLLHAVKLRHGNDGFISPPKEGVLRIFLP